MQAAVGALYMIARFPDRGRVIDGRFLSINQQLEKSTMLETVWIDKDTFQFSAVAWYTVGHRQPLHSLFANTGISFSITEI